MAYLGYGLIGIFVVLCIYGFLKRIEFNRKHISILVVLALTGIILIIGNRITEIDLLRGKIKASLEEAASDMQEIKNIKEEISITKDSIFYLIKDIDIAKKQLDKLDSLYTEARNKLESISNSQQEAEEKLKRLDSLNSFLITLTKALNDDRNAFDELLKIANDKNSPFYEIANKAIQRIALEVNPLYSIRVDPDIPWEKIKVDPKNMNFETFISIYQSAHPAYRPKLLSALWTNEKITKYQKLQFLSKVIQSDSSLKAVDSACRLMNKEAGLNKNILGKELYLEWWNKNKDNFKLQEK